MRRETTPDLVRLINKGEHDAGDVMRAYIETQGGGALLGPWSTMGRRSVPLVSDSRAAFGVLGGPGSGKTRGVIKAAVALHPGSTVSLTTKPEVMVDTIASRTSEGRVFVLDLSGLGNTLPPCAIELRWSPVNGADDYDVALLRAHQMVRAQNPGRQEGATLHFNDSAANLLAALLCAAALSGRTVADVRRWAAEGETREPADYLPDNHVARVALHSVENMGDKERGSVCSSAARVLGAYQSPTALRTATARVYGEAAQSLDADSFVRSDGDTLSTSSAPKSAESSWLHS
jgi:type IV secretion system protein VirD4